MGRRGGNILAALTALLGWGGLTYLVNFTSPQPYAWMLFLVLLLVTLAATFFLPLQYLYRRLAKTVSARVLRQSFWLAFFGVLCAWLQMRRVLDWTVALLLAAVFWLAEVYLLSRE